MDATVRRSFQGVTNIIRFNWHLYAIAGTIILILSYVMVFLHVELFWTSVVIFLTAFPVFVSLIVSCYVYDLSGLYQFQWMNQLGIEPASRIVNVNAGFDETSAILKAKFLNADLFVFDFYDPEKHTEVSIARARKIYREFPSTKRISTNDFPLQSETIDCIFNIFSLHEIRDHNERAEFLRLQHAALKKDGYCIVMEHLRDLPNFFAYTIGFFHFHSRRTWRLNFFESGFNKIREIKVTPFVRVFILSKTYGAAS